MAPATGTALLVLVAFVLPGFVALWIGERTHVVPVRNRQPFELLLLATYYSVISWGIIALASWPFGLDRAGLRRMYREESLGQLAGLGLLAVLVVPAFVATAARLWRRSQVWRPRVLKWLRIHEGHTIPTAWDEMFGRRRPAMVRAVLSDKRIVGGYYGGQSFPGYGEQSQDLLLEQQWLLDDEHWFKEPIKNSHGLWLSAGSIVSLELYDPDYEQRAIEAAKSPPAKEEGSGAPASEAGGQADDSSGKTV
jgi:hypothetical protein